MALQDPGTAFTDSGLRKAKLTPGLGGPWAMTGSSAVVYQATIEREQYALRCYTRQDASTPERYAALDSFVDGSGLRKYVGTVTWYEQEVQVKGGKWPLLKMDWIDGEHLHEYVGLLADSKNTAALATLAGHWVHMVNELQQAKFAHGDLQHGNILVDKQRRLRLVDFDSVWIPPLYGQPPPAETGHSNFQPPSICARSRWGQYMDTFAGLAVYVALTALARDPGLWPMFNSGENVLFERTDFVPPHDTRVWKCLTDIGDRQLDGMAAKLKECCTPDWTASQPLADMLTAKWWERTGGSAATPVASKRAEAPTSTWRGSVISAPAVASTGSLPPMPTSPYQSPVASQVTAPLHTAGWQGGPARLSSAASGSGAWWERAQGHQAGGTASSQPVTRPHKPPVKPVSRTPARQTGADPGLVTVSVLFVIAGIATWIGLATHHHALRGAAIGLVLIVVGIVLAWIGKPKPSKR